MQRTRSGGRHALRRTCTIAAVLLLSGLVAAPRAAAQQKRIYIAPDDHTDYFWSGLEDTYRQVFVDVLDYYLDQADATTHLPAPYQSRWNCDGSFWLWTYEREKTPAEFQRLIDRIRSGHISAPLNPLCVCPGGAPAEAVLRGMYYPGRLERRFDLRFRLAVAMENQTLPFGLPSLWAGSGALYSWKGICGCDSLIANAWNREHEIYRAVGPDGASVLMKWNSMLTQDNRRMGGYAEARFPDSVIDFVTTSAPFNGFLSRYPYSVIGCFGQGWDDLQTMNTDFVAVAQAKTNAARQVIVSNELDFFVDFESTHGANLPAVACSFGNEWDLYCASMSETTARVKRAVEKLRAAEALAAVVVQFDPAFMDGREPARDLAWMNLGLFWEHNFGMVGAPTGSAGVTARIAWQKRLADEIDAYVNDLHNDAADALAGLIPAAGPNPRFYAFNPLGWPRSDHADLPYSGATPVHVVDVATQAAVPSELIFPAGQPTLRIWAADVPAVGYRVYEIRPGVGPLFPPSGMVNATMLENFRYRITLAPRGAITSIIDKADGDRELVQTFGGLACNDFGGSTGMLTLDGGGSVSVTMRATGFGSPAYDTTYTLYCAGDRIEIVNRIQENFSTTRTWAFGWNLSSPAVRHEETGAIVRAGLAGSNGNYSPHAARYDWLTLNHFADAVGINGAGVTLSNADCCFMRLGASTTSFLDTGTPQFRVLAGGRVVNGGNGIPAQGGDTLFTQRFAIRAYTEYDPASAMRFALEHQNPLVCRTIAGATPQLPEDEFTGFAASNPNLLLWVLKPSDDGPEAGLVARVWNLSSTAESGTMQLSPRPIGQAFAATHIETDEAELAVAPGGLAASFAPQQMRTFRLLSPAACPDFDSDNDTDAADLAVFVNVLLKLDTDPARITASDLDGDGVADADDVPAMVQCLVDGARAAGAAADAAPGGAARSAAPRAARRRAGTL